MHRADEVGAVVHRDIGTVGKRGTDVFVIGGVIFAFDGENVQPMIADQVRRDVVLRGQGVGCAQRDVGAAGLQCDREIRRLGRDVQARRQPLSRKRPVASEPLPELPQHRHRALSPFGTPAAFVGEPDVLDVVRGFGFGRGLRHWLSWSYERPPARPRLSALPPDRRAPR